MGGGIVIEELRECTVIEVRGRSITVLGLRNLSGGVSGASPRRPTMISRCFLMVGQRSKRAGPTLP